MTLWGFCRDNYFQLVCIFGCTIHCCRDHRYTCTKPSTVRQYVCMVKCHMSISGSSIYCLNLGLFDWLMLSFQMFIMSRTKNSSAKKMVLIGSGVWNFSYYWTLIIWIKIYLVLNMKHRRFMFTSSYQSLVFVNENVNTDDLKFYKNQSN